MPFLSAADLLSPLLGGTEAASVSETPKVADPPKAPSQDEQIQYLRQANRDAEARIGSLSKIIGEQREMAESIKAAITACPPLSPIEYTHSDRGSAVVVPVLVFSDWHIGECISSQETEEFGEYNWDIATKRLALISSSFLRWIKTNRHGYRIDDCVIIGCGDYIAGDIHRELSVTNEFPVPVQTARAGLLFGEVVADIARSFKHVTVFQVGADNHGRLERKPQFKQKFQNSYSYLVNTIAETYLSRQTNVEIIAATGMKKLATIADHRFLIEHGDTVKSWMGVPYYGIERSRAREATKRMTTDKSFHYQIMGHWHVPAWFGGNIFVNGSLSGTSEFDHGCGRHADPAQIAFLVHPIHGVFNYVPFKVT